jgi:hypothetical protein
MTEPTPESRRMHLNGLPSWLHALGPAAATTTGMTAEQNLTRAGEWAARCEVLIELEEKRVQAEADERGGDVHDYVETDTLCAMYALAAIARAQLATAAHMIRRDR